MPTFDTEVARSHSRPRCPSWWSGRRSDKVINVVLASAAHEYTQPRTVEGPHSANADTYFIIVAYCSVRAHTRRMRKCHIHPPIFPAHPTTKERFALDVIGPAFGAQIHEKYDRPPCSHSAPKSAIHHGVDFHCAQVYLSSRAPLPPRSALRVRQRCFGRPPELRAACWANPS